MTNQTPEESAAEAKAAAAETRGALTPDSLLKRMRDIEGKLYNRETELRVKDLPQPEIQAFVDARAAFTAAIAAVVAAKLEKLAAGLVAHGKAIEAGTARLQGDLSRLENAAAWAGAVTDVLGTIGKVITLAT